MANSLNARHSLKGCVEVTMEVKIVSMKAASQVRMKGFPTTGKENALASARTLQRSRKACS